jgi:hypothetical protein
MTCVVAVVAAADDDGVAPPSVVAVVAATDGDGVAPPA